MITFFEKWHYLAVKELSASLKGMTSNHKGNFYSLNCLDSYSTENKLKKHKGVCKNHDYCYIEISKDLKKIINF